MGKCAKPTAPMRKGFSDNKKAALEGGTVAGNARRELEEKSGTKISTKENYKEIPKLNARQSSRIKRLNNHERSKNTQYSQKRRLVEIFNTGFPPLRE